MRLYKISSQLKFIIDFPLGEQKFLRKLAKDKKIRYFPFNSSYSENYNRKFKKLRKKKEIDFFYSGKINPQIIEQFENLKKDTKINIVYHSHMPNEKRKHFISISKFGLSVPLNKIQNLYSTMRIGFHMTIGLPLLYVGKPSFFYPRWAKKFIYECKFSDLKDNMNKLILNYNFYLKDFKIKRRVYIKTSKKFKTNFKKFLFR